MDKEKYIFSDSLNNLQEPYFYGYLKEAIDRGYSKILVDVLPKVKVGKLYEHTRFNEDYSHRFINGFKILNAPDISGNFVSISDFKQ